MPLYQFQCRDCESDFEVRRSFAQASEPVACDCGSNNTRKLLNAIAFSVGATGSSQPRQKPNIPLAMRGGCCAGGGVCGCH